MQRIVDKRESATIVTAGRRRFYRVYWILIQVAQCSNSAACMAGHARLRQAMAGPVEEAETCQLQQSLESRLGEPLRLGDCCRTCLPIDRAGRPDEHETDAQKRAFALKEGSGVAGASAGLGSECGIFENALVLAVQNHNASLLHVHTHDRVRFHISPTRLR
jgi:hypothetical protein